MRKLPLGKIYSFSSEEVKQLLHNKFVVVMGDSIYRSMYKDLVYLLQTDELLTLNHLKTKAEPTFAKDRLVKGGNLHARTDYREEREYCTHHHLVRFYFITRIYSDYMESVLKDFQAEPKPDVIIFNSCLWDLNRYHDSSPECQLSKAIMQYFQNLKRFFQRLDAVVPQDCFVIWATALPIANETYGSLFADGNSTKSGPLDLVEANFYSASVACSYGFDVLDLHYCFRFLDEHHSPDGLHWNSLAHRLITKRLLTYMAESWGVELGEKRLNLGIEQNGTEANQQASSEMAPPQQPLQLPPSAQLYPGPSPANGLLTSQLVPDSELYDSYNDPYRSGSMAEFEFNHQRPPAACDQFGPFGEVYHHPSDRYSHGHARGFAFNDQQSLPHPDWLLPIHPLTDYSSDLYINGLMNKFEYVDQGLLQSQQPSDHHSDQYSSGQIGGFGYNDQEAPFDHSQLNLDGYNNTYSNGPTGGAWNTLHAPPHLQQEVDHSSSSLPAQGGPPRRRQRRRRQRFITQVLREDAHPYARQQDNTRSQRSRPPRGGFYHS